MRIQHHAGTCTILRQRAQAVHEKQYPAVRNETEHFRGIAQVSHYICYPSMHVFHQKNWIHSWKHTLSGTACVQANESEKASAGEGSSCVGTVNETVSVSFQGIDCANALPRLFLARSLRPYDRGRFHRCHHPCNNRKQLQQNELAFVATKATVQKDRREDTQFENRYLMRRNARRPGRRIKHHTDGIILGSV